MSVESPRVTPDDELFLRTHRALGVAVASQMVWRFAQMPERTSLQRLHARLAVGPLSRRAVAGRWPMERPTWRAASHLAPLEVHDVVEHDELAWARDVARGLDPFDGPPWRLACLPLDGEGALVSLAVAHAVADGAAMSNAVVAAVTGTALPIVPPGPRGSGFGEARGQARAIVTALACLTRDAARRSLSTPPTGADRTVPHRPESDPTRPARVVAVDVQRDAWRRAAEAAGGSENSLFLAVTTAVAAHDERRPPVVVPVARRDSGGGIDVRSNVSTGVTVTLTQPVHDRGDLHRVRAETRAALAAAPAPPVWQPIARALPDAAIARLAGEAPGPACLASSMGEAPSALVALFGEPAEAILMHATSSPTTTAGTRHHLGGGLSAWSSATPSTVTLTFAGTDDMRFPDTETLSRRVRDELTAWGLTGVPW